MRIDTAHPERYTQGHIQGTRIFEIHAPVFANVKTLCE
jgi:hypothetical protein